MKMLVIFNTKNGQIMYTQSGSSIEDGIISNLTVEVPEGKVIDKYDNTTGRILFKNIPKSDLDKTNEKIDNLQSQLQETMTALDIIINGGVQNNG